MTAPECRCYPRLASMTPDERAAMQAMTVRIGVHKTFCPAYVDRSPRRNPRVGQLESLR